MSAARVAALVVLFLLGAGACGDDGEPAAGPDDTAGPDAGTPPEDPGQLVQPTDVPGLEVGLSPTEFAPPVDWSVTVFNTTDGAVTFEFSSGQRADLSLLDASGSGVYTWSDQRSFTAALGSEQVPAGESITFTLDGEDLGLEPGTYTAVVSVTASEPLAAEFTVELLP